MDRNVFLSGCPFCVARYSIERIGVASHRYGM
jgi:hypothetical protein